MLDRCFHRPRVIRRLRANPLAEDLERLTAYLLDRGHSQRVIQGYIQAVEHFGQWLGHKGILPSAVDEDVVGRFLKCHLPRCRCPPPASCQRTMLHAALRHLLHVKQGRSSGTEPPSGLTPLDAVIHAFDLHMRDVRGLAPSTRLYRVRYVREFLQSVFGRGPLRLDRLVVADPMGFITAYARRCSPATAQVAASALRSFLRFLQLQGLCEARLVAAIPSIPHWDLAGIPRTLTEQQVKQLLASFDRATATGRRDYAMALCMVDLGLRVSDVVRLRLQDIDWRQSTVTVSGVKPRRCNVLPLPQRIGKAIADYVRRGRPRSQHVEVFLGHRAPVGAATRETLVRGVMNRAYARCGLDPRCRGTHVLRHTAASRMLQRGATLKQIADILGHRSIDTSAIYAKVNCPMLASVAMPWPEVKP